MYDNVSQVYTLKSTLVVTSSLKNIIIIIIVSQVYTLKDFDDDGDDHDDNPEGGANCIPMKMHNLQQDTADVGVMMAVHCLHIVSKSSFIQREKFSGKTKTHTMADTRRMNNKHWTTHVDLSVALRSFPTVPTTMCKPPPAVLRTTPCVQ